MSISVFSLAWGGREVGVPGIISAGIIASQVVTDALDFEGARFLAKALALATGDAVHLTYTNAEGEHHICSHPDHYLDVRILVSEN